MNTRLLAVASLALAAAIALPASLASAAECTPGKTKKIAFMLKQQTAFRYLNADIPFFKKTAGGGRLRSAGAIGGERCAEPDLASRQEAGLLNAAR